MDDRILKKSRLNKNRQLKNRYGITLEEKEAMFKKQNGLCKICKSNKRLIVEHDHETGKVRGLTCDRCNQLLSHLEPASFELIMRATEYIQQEGNID